MASFVMVVIIHGVGPRYVFDRDIWSCKAHTYHKKSHTICAYYHPEKEYLFFIHSLFMVCTFVKIPRRSNYKIHKRGKRTNKRLP